MGEYARFNGEEVKIGTCEDMYYLRADQRGLVRFLPGNVNVNSEDVYGLRFRFPWPDEDKIAPGDFERHDRSVRVDVPMPQGVEHYSVQFRASAGYLTSLDCPESGKSIEGVRIARNGFSGSVHLVQQKVLRDGRIVPVMKCGGCGALWRCEEPDEIRAIAQAFREEGERRRKDAWTGKGESKQFVGHVFYHTIAQRILSGARLEVDKVVTV